VTFLIFLALGCPAFGDFPYYKYGGHLVVGINLNKDTL